MQGVFIGHPRSGKTTSKKRLVGKKPELNEPSTGVAEKVTELKLKNQQSTPSGKK